MDISTFQAYGYFGITVFMVVALYSYIYHLYSKKKDVTGVDYEAYSNMALNDDITDEPVKKVSKDETQKVGE